jgi:prolyl-tRNA synthetase
MIILPLGYALWEKVQVVMDAEFKKTGVENVYFPALIPSSLLEKEAEHVEGFSPQLAVVTHGGGKKLTEPLVIRPTSETIIWQYYANRIQSYRQLPLLINQWCNVMRWEMRTRLFLRTTEFLWQEGHTAHATLEEAQDRTLTMLGIYRKFLEDYMAIPAYAGIKSNQKKFAGAETSYSLKVMVQDYRAVQAATSHNFGQRFSKAFGVNFLDEEDQRQYAYTTSWGSSTRLIGTLVMVHGDDRGLILPPRIAPTQLVIVPISDSDSNKQQVFSAGRELEGTLSDAGYRVKADYRDLKPVQKFYDWELRGVPLRLEIGLRELKANEVTLVRRDTGEKRTVHVEGLTNSIESLLADIQVSMLNRAREFRDNHTFTVDGFEEFVQVLQEKRGFLRAHWCGSVNCENDVKAETEATIRTIPLDAEPEDGQCVYCGKPSTRRVLFAKSY